ncbi:hypothetical protein HCUR_00352 [Holospora curviuscula]|uniref:Uncharacterized protein n=1 Tax=Holospora curviuscula TaxID=1082868 RepID=A0A2S5RD99_9PROT|nr:hypothetical protein HCUR_00352 [Holospora curviuscula]
MIKKIRIVRTLKNHEIDPFNYLSYTMSYFLIIITLLINHFFTFFYPHSSLGNSPYQNHFHQYIQDFSWVHLLLTSRYLSSVFFCFPRAKRCFYHPILAS